MPPTNDNSLTPLQLEMLQLLADGKTQQEVAAELKVADQTVSNWMQVARDVLDAETTVHAVVIAVRQQLID